MRKETLRIAAVADIHCGRKSHGSFQTLFAQAGEEADILLICGDLTDYGLPEEARMLVKELGHTPKIPVLAVLGNHDYEGGKHDEICHILNGNGIQVLDGESFEYHGVGFAGVKGFGGGFGRRMLEPWGEHVIKSFVHEAVGEALRLESALAKMGTEQRVVLLHYSPVEDTVRGEPIETFPFLGSSRLEEPINRYGCSMVFHGHAHHGAPEGKTRENIPVYNVAAALLRQHFPESPLFRILTLPLLYEEPGLGAPPQPGAPPAGSSAPQPPPPTSPQF